LGLCSLLPDLQHLGVDVKHRHVPRRRLLRLAWLLLLLLLLLFCGSDGAQHPEGHIASAARHVEVLHALEGAQHVHQPEQWRPGARGVPSGQSVVG
jgi:hypothetical protein